MRRVALVLAATTMLTLLLASGVALAVNKLGTNGADTLRGTDGRDTLLGLRGNDDLLGLGGHDNMLGGPGKDNVVGGDVGSVGGGDKILSGDLGNDVVLAGRGSDTALGGAGNDYLQDGLIPESSKDTLSGGPGNDVITGDHVPAFRDLVVCGPGFDWVLADSRDVVAPDCEKVWIVQGSRKQVVRQEEHFLASVPQSFFEGLPPFPQQ